MKGLRHGIRAYGLQVTVLAAVWIGFAVTTPLFRGISSLYSVAESFALLGLIAVGMSVTVFAGELDLSVASIAALAGVFGVKFSGMGLIPDLLAVTLACALLGAVQGFLIHRLAINSLVFTVASLIALRGLVYISAGNQTMPLKDLSISDPLLSRWSFLSPDSLVSLSAFVLIGLFLGYTRRGREAYAAGGDRRAAFAAGVPIGRVVITAFAVSAACAGLAGALASVKGGSASPDSYGDLLLNAPAAILVGGVSLQDGRGTVANVFLGVAILGVVTSGLGDRGVQAYTVNLVVGGLLVVVVVAQFLLDHEHFARAVSAMRGPRAGPEAPASAR